MGEDELSKQNSNEQNSSKEAQNTSVSTPQDKPPDHYTPREPSIQALLQTFTKLMHWNAIARTGFVVFVFAVIAVFLTIAIVGIWSSFSRAKITA